MNPTCATLALLSVALFSAALGMWLYDQCMKAPHGRETADGWEEVE
jgi:hypothetical protein